MVLRMLQCHFSPFMGSSYRFHDFAFEAVLRVISQTRHACPSNQAGGNDAVRMSQGMLNEGFPDGSKPKLDRYERFT